MTRLAYGLTDWEDRPFQGEEVLTAAAIDAEEATFRNARLWDYRPLGDTLDQLQARPSLLRLPRRGHRPLHHRRRPAPGHAVRPRARPEPEPAGDRVREPAHRLHPRHRRRDGPGQRGRQRGPAAAVHPQPPAGLDRRRAGDHRAAHLLRREAERLRHHRRPAGRVRLPDRRGRGRRWTPAPRRAGAARPASSSTRRCHACCSRCASATWTCSSATRSPPRASCCSIARWTTGSTTSRRSCATTRTRTS